MEKVRVRYAPSPTGDPHIGNIRLAVFDWLFARHHGGTFITRLEDTDQNRLVEGSSLGLLQAMQWLGMEADEGLYIDGQGNIAERGEYGPYTQSQRLSIYQSHVQELLDAGKAYRCFATPEELEAMRTAQAAAHQPPRYDRRFRDLPRSESDAKAQAGERFVIRQKMPLTGEVLVSDIVRGTVKFQASELEDHVLLKSDGFPTYQLANVVDDHLMQISHVYRGE
ncbi:MAG: glutamate--tRNA ligase family protein, partial [Methanothrix sp.]